MKNRYTARSVRRASSRNKKNFYFTLILIFVLIYATIFWVLPNLIGGIGLLNNSLHPSEKVKQPSEDLSLAPPVLNIPFEATNSSLLTIQGYSTGKKVKIFIDDEVEDIVDVSSDGTFQASNINLKLGGNNIYGKTLDENDKESLSSKTIKVEYDNDKPKLEVTEPNENKSIQGERRLKITGKTDPEAIILINGGRAIVNSDGNFSSEQNLNDGENIFKIKSMDEAGNSTEIERRINFTP